jgi:hypothetical protein
MSDSYLFLAGWLFFAAWIAVVGGVTLAAFGHDLLLWLSPSDSARAPRRADSIR